MGNADTLKQGSYLILSENWYDTAFANELNGPFVGNLSRLVKTRPEYARFYRQALAGEHPHLVPEQRSCTGSRPVIPVGSLVQRLAQKIEILSHTFSLSDSAAQIACFRSHRSSCNCHIYPLFVKCLSRNTMYRLGQTLALGKLAHKSYMYV